MKEFIEKKIKDANDEGLYVLYEETRSNIKHIKTSKLQKRWKCELNLILQEIKSRNIPLPTFFERLKYFVLGR